MVHHAAARAAPNHFYEALELPPDERAHFLETHAPDDAVRDEVVA